MAAQAGVRAESDLHKANVKACASDTTCLAQEEARQRAAIAGIQNQRKVCQNGCHHQGGGGRGALAAADPRLGRSPTVAG